VTLTGVYAAAIMQVTAAHVRSTCHNWHMTPSTPGI